MNGSEQRVGYWLGAALLIASSWAGMRAAERVVPLHHPAVRSLPSDVRQLEARLGHDRRDLAAARGFAERFLAWGVPGQAEAVLRWTAPELQSDPQIASLRVQSLSALGDVDGALVLQRSILAACANADCSPTLFAHGKKRERVLSELQRQGVTDPARQPERVALAYDRATRSVRLAN